MMLSSRILSGLVMAVWIGLSCGRPDGAPSGACDGMVPGHGVDGKTDAPPYDIHVTPYTYCGPDTPVKVKLVGAPYGEDFKGFLCQPRTDVDVYQTVGTFSQQDGTQSKCGNTVAALTHVNNTQKRSIEFTWTPDSNVKDSVNIVCTIVKNKNTFWVKQSVVISYAGESRCQNPGELPTSCTTNQTCDAAVSMSKCVQGVCKCPDDMKIANPKDTYCSNKKLGDNCDKSSDCFTIPDSVCDTTCKCAPGFKNNATSGPCYPKVLHDACASDDECRLTNHSKCIDSTCQCPRAGFIEIGNATHKNCSKTSLPTVCSTDQDCASISKSVCKTGVQPRYCECPTNLVLLNPMDKMCSEKPTDAATTVVLSALMLIGCLTASVI